MNTPDKGHRLRRCGEVIQAGDMEPDGPTWKPVRQWLIGTEVSGCCYRPDGSPDFILGQRKRRMPKAQEQRVAARRAANT